jgi:glucuronate isomerase
MKTNQVIAPVPTPVPAHHRYQVFRQAKNGVHHNYGSSMASAEEAVEVFLETPPLFEGGGIRLWDHREQRAVAATEWLVETTHFGFPVRTRANAFFDDAIASCATKIIEREAYFESVAQRLGIAS